MLDSIQMPLQLIIENLFEKLAIISRILLFVNKISDLT